MTSPSQPTAAPGAPASPAPVVLPTRAGYDLWADTYDSDGNPLIMLEERHTALALGDVRGLEVADIGCGTGRHSLDLARRGARVTAVDFSEGMLRKARGKPGAESIRFVTHDITTRLPLESGAFERVLCALVLDHIARLDAFLAELGRICSPTGKIVVSSFHPALMLRGVQARFTDPATGLETRPESVANQISDYVMGALRAGLIIESLSEHAVDQQMAEASPRAARYLGWPMLLMMTLRPPRAGR